MRYQLLDLCHYLEPDQRKDKMTRCLRPKKNTTRSLIKDNYWENVFKIKYKMFIFTISKILCSYCNVYYNIVSILLHQLFIILY